MFYQFDWFSFMDIVFYITENRPNSDKVMLDLGITQFSRKIDPVDLPGFELEPVEQRVNLSSKQVFKT